MFALLKKNVKITKERIPAATQLFTPDWIVRYMVENSLGRLWVEGHPNESLKANWKYYLEEAEQEPDVVEQLNKIREEYAKINPVDIKVIDPCMGSGHILVYAFDVLMQIYTSQGYIERDAAKSILMNNLYGIDIDVRAYQLAYFAVMMKARQYNRKIFNEHIMPNLIAIRNPENISKSVLKRLGGLEPLGFRLVEDFENAEEYGSILQVNYTENDLQLLDMKLEEIDRMADYGNLLVQMESSECCNLLWPLIKQARLLSQKYDVVVTNPPYMGSSGMGNSLAQYVKAYYPNSKSDLFAVFIEHGFQMLKEHGFESMITMESWMFLSSFETMRININATKTIINLVHMPYLGKGGTSLGINFGTDMAVMRNAKTNCHIGVYDRISYYETDEQGVPFEFPVHNEYYKRTSQDAYTKIPGSPIAYWVSKGFIRAYNNPTLSDQSRPCKGIDTGDNNVFLRLWFEVDEHKMLRPQVKPIELEYSKSYKWFPYNKGGDYRRWFGNNSYLINWENEGEQLKAFPKSNLRNKDCYMNHGITWSTVTSGQSSMRYFDYGFFFDNGGSCLFASNHLYYILAFLNSVVANHFLGISPTLNTQPGDIGKLPFSVDQGKVKIVEDFAVANISLSKEDWDSYELSWDFKLHPLVRLKPVMLSEQRVYGIPGSGTKAGCEIHVGTIEQAFLKWETESEKRFIQLKSNEEELNRIFIDIYDLRDELIPNIEDKDIPIRKANLARDIRSLVSYAVGCMFGRYSLDIPGLVYAGGEWDRSKYQTFIPDLDNCIPITDEEYFSDDIVGRFVEFIRTAFGEETLEENLDYIATALDNKGNTSREVIRNYFLNDFYKDHCQMYSVTGSGRRPIYWLFDSGKENGFKALVYMHRWNADTVGNLRIEYLHKMQTVYEREIENCQDMIDHGSGRDVAAAVKRKEKLVKQLKECRDYDALVAHIAFSKVDINLDDGVKANYRKVQTGSDGKFCEILAASREIMAKEK